MDPYAVLGVSRTALPEDIRAAYLSRVKEFHPDRFSDPLMKEQAGEKLKLINRAYEMIGKNKERDNEPASYGCEYSAESTAYSGPYAAGFLRVRSLIGHGNLGAAAAILDSMRFPNAEWNYLYGIIHMRQGRLEDAFTCIDYAYHAAPQNREYRNAYITLHKTSAAKYRPKQHRKKRFSFLRFLFSG